ncbi:MAG TPA: peptidase [Lacipirellulaceae bacterium]|nr:peptidase [Lacipirellulaceae bacterium]
MSSTIRRREFLKVAAGAAAMAAVPGIVAAKKTDSPVIVGSGDYKYEAQHNWPQLPHKYTWQTTHDVAFDKAGNLYVIHEGHKDKPDHPAIFVFDADGKFIRAFGQEFQGGGHGLEVHEEKGEEFLYVTAYQSLKKFAKLTLKGETVWVRHAPMESGIYTAGEDKSHKAGMARNRFQPTNIAFCPDGKGFYVADGYGAYVIHMYDQDAHYQSTFGKPGASDGQFNLPHGVWTDTRVGREPSVVVADRVNGRLQWFTLDGKYRETQGGFLLPANVDTFGELMLVPELQARITLLDGKNKVIARFGDDEAWRKIVMAPGLKARQHPEKCPAGKFLHPHDACFDVHGNIFIAEWVATGRVTKLRKLS